MNNWVSTNTMEEIRMSNFRFERFFFIFDQNYECYYTTYLIKKNNWSKMKFLSPAKLNLNLRVISKRIDGYHNLETTFQFIDLFDEISFEKSNESFNISCDGLEIEPKNNLIFKSFFFFFVIFFLILSKKLVK